VCGHRRDERVRAHDASPEAHVTRMSAVCEWSQLHGDDDYAHLKYPLAQERMLSAAAGKHELSKLCKQWSMRITAFAFASATWKPEHITLDCYLTFTMQCRIHLLRSFATAACRDSTHAVDFSRFGLT
jgi:hypothetical protein